jgi:RHS repeat-associated protein
LGRVTGRSINGGSNASSIVFDDLGRVSSFINPLTTGTYTYLGATALVTSGSYANGQRMNFGYYGAAGDERLQEIQNLDPSSNVISQFNYGYDSEGEITSWQQQNSALTGTNSYGLAYDGASQLMSASLNPGNGGSSTSYGWWYDNAGNRTQEQIGSATTISTYNGLNQLTGQSPTGPTHFRGTMSKWGMVTVGGTPAVVSGTGPTYQFDGVANLVAGSNTVQIVATATSGVSGTSTYQVTVPSGSGRSFTYDADGEMTNNGAGQRYQWDAANRLAAIWYGPIGSSSNTTFTYNGLGQWVGITENDASGNPTSAKQFVWFPGDAQPSEERDANGTKRFYPQGEQISGTNYFYTTDHLGSVREMTAATSGSVQDRYDYDLWGKQTKLTETIDADFGYAGYYQHQQSELNLTMFRAYDPNLGRWLSRDPIGEEGSLNLYAYVTNDPCLSG